MKFSELAPRERHNFVYFLLFFFFYYFIMSAGNAANLLI